MDIRNLSISSSKPDWRRFVLVAATGLLLFPFLCYSFVMLIDPYDNLPFSLNMERVPIDKRQRLFHPALARNPHFDSAVIGNSNIRLLRPTQLNDLLEGNFVNLGINAASSWEQKQIFDVFVRNHRKVKNIIFGLDYLWCKEKFAEQKFVGASKAENFPGWMYDERIDNNLPPLNVSTMKHAWRQMLVASGLGHSKYGSDGYTEFTKPMSEYNLAKARKKIYGSEQPRSRNPVSPPVTMSSEDRAQIRTPALNRLRNMLEALPDTTRKVLLFVPYHSYFQPRPDSKDAIVWEECKQRVVKLAAAAGNAYVTDFMIRSSITNRDENYWDHKHYTVEVAELLGKLIGGAVNNRSSDNRYRRLYAPNT